MTTTAPADTTTRHAGRPPGTSGWRCSRSRMGGFAIGTTEFVTMGLLPQIARGRRASRSRPPATSSRRTPLGVVVGAPVLAFFGAQPAAPRPAGRADGWRYAVGNALSALPPTPTGCWCWPASSTGLPHGAYFGVASLVAARWPRPAARAAPSRW